MSREMALRLESEVFDEVRAGINNYLQITLAKMDDSKSNEAELTVKLNIKFDRMDLPVISKTGDNDLREAIFPQLSHKITSIIKTKYDTGGKFVADGDYELVKSNDSHEYIMRKIVDPQQSLYDTE